MIPQKMHWPMTIGLIPLRKFSSNTLKKFLLTWLIKTQINLKPRIMSKSELFSEYALSRNGSRRNSCSSTSLSVPKDSRKSSPPRPTLMRSRPLMKKNTMRPQSPSSPNATKRLLIDEREEQASGSVPRNVDEGCKSKF